MMSCKNFLDWIGWFHNMSTPVELFYSKISLAITVSNIISNRSIQAIDGTLTGTATQGQSGYGNNGSGRGEFKLPKAWEMEPHHQMQISITPRTFF